MQLALDYVMVIGGLIVAVVLVIVGMIALNSISCWIAKRRDESFLRGLDPERQRLLREVAAVDYASLKKSVIRHDEELGRQKLRELLGD